MKKCLIAFELSEAYIAQLKNIANQYAFISCTEASGLRGHLSDMEILFTFVAKIDSEMLASATKLKWIQAITAGIDHLPLVEIKAREIILTNARGIHKISMAEYALAAMINLARNFHVMHANQMKAKWDRSISQAEIYGQVVGILGLGSIGREIAKKASFLGMRVIGVQKDPQPMAYVDRVYGPTQINALFKQSDYVINLLPLTTETQGIINKRCFGLMKKTASFINLGRGPTVNQADLIEALRSKRIAGLVADVYAAEPLPQDSPLWKLDNVILTPHIAGVSPNYIQRAMDIITHNLKVYVGGCGKMINVVNFEAGY